MPLNELLAGTAVLASVILGMRLAMMRRKFAEQETMLGTVHEAHHRALARVAAEQTARVGVEQALGAAEGRMCAVLEAAVDGIVTIDETGRIQTFNRAAERIFQYRAAEVLERNVNVLMPEPYSSAHDHYLKNYLSTGKARIIGIGREVTGRRKDGSTFPMELAVGESRLQGRRIFAGIVRDITERNLAKEQLWQSEERFRLLVDGVRDYAFSLMDPSGGIISWNHGAERMTGWPADKVVGRDFSLFFTPEDVAVAEPQRILAMALRDKGVECEIQQQKSDGSTYWSHITITPLLDESGGLRGYVRIARDLTEQRAQEESLRQAKDEAERANTAKSKFLAAASHDLRQPVQALMFFMSALSLKLQDSPGASLLADAEHSLAGLNTLLESLLDVSRLDAGAVVPQIETFPLAPILERLESEFGPAAREKGVSLRAVTTSGFVRSDPALLGRILNNLVSNAVRYTDKGKITVGCRPSGKSLRIEVWDSGVGIPADRVDDIFLEFTQLGNTERNLSQGLGLGLAIVQRLTDLLGHRLCVRSIPGKGSVFSVELPRAAECEMVHPPQPVMEGGRRLVIIIDDEMSVLKGLRMILEAWGYEVIAAGSEEEAIGSLEHRRRRPSAILADYRLRDGHTGAEAVRSIRALFNQQIPSIIITGDTAPERIREAEASGFRILHKPVQPPQLHSILVSTMAN